MKTYSINCEVAIVSIRGSKWLRSPIDGMEREYEYVIAYMSFDNNLVIYVRKGIDRYVAIHRDSDPRLVRKFCPVGLLPCAALDDNIARELLNRTKKKFLVIVNRKYDVTLPNRPPEDVFLSASVVNLSGIEFNYDKVMRVAVDDIEMPLEADPRELFYEAEDVVVPFIPSTVTYVCAQGRKVMIIEINLERRSIAFREEKLELPCHEALHNLLYIAS